MTNWRARIKKKAKELTDFILCESIFIVIFLIITGLLFIIQTVFFLLFFGQLRFTSETYNILALLLATFWTAIEWVIIFIHLDLAEISIYYTPDKELN